MSASITPKTIGLTRQTYSLPEVAALLGFAYSSAYEAVREGTFPIPSFKTGRVFRFAKSDVHRLLGIDPDAPLIRSDEEDAA